MTEWLIVAEAYLLPVRHLGELSSILKRLLAFLVNAVELFKKLFELFCKQKQAFEVRNNNEYNLLTFQQA